MSDTFKLSLGLAQQLEFAFRRNGWTLDEIHKLCKGDLLAKARVVLLPSVQMVGEQRDGDATYIATAEVARLRVIERRYQELCAQLEFRSSFELYDESLENIFTREHARELGFNPRNSAAARNCFRWSLGEYDRTVNGHKGIKTLGELVQVTEFELMRAPYVGKTVVGFIKKALEVRGLHLGMKPLPNSVPTE